MTAPLLYLHASRRCNECGGSGDPFKGNPAGMDLHGNLDYSHEPCTCSGSGRVDVDCTAPCPTCGGWTRYENDGKVCPNPDCVDGRVPADWAGIHIGDPVIVDGKKGTVTSLPGNGGVMLDFDDGRSNKGWRWQYGADANECTLDLDALAEDQTHRLACNRYKEN